MRRMGRRMHVRWCAWAVSGLLHAGAMISLSAVLEPLDLGRVGELLLSVEVAPEPPPVDSLQLPGVEIAEALPLPDVFEAGDEIAPPGDLAGAAGQGVDDGELQTTMPLTELAADLTVELVALTSPRPKKISPRRRRDENRAGKQASFFGTVAYGDTFVYVLDASGSMASGRFDRAREELMQSVEALRETQSFYVLLFNNSARWMFDDAEQDEALPATLLNKARLRRWLARVQPDGGTDPREALRIGLGLRPSALFLLSDGQFNLDGQTHRSRLRHGDSKVHDMVGKRGRKAIPIHTFAYECPAAAENMQKLASSTGGEYRFVEATPSPPASSSPAAPAASAPTGSANPPLDDLAAAWQSEALLMEAESLEARGELTAALAEYQKIIDAYPRTPAAQAAGLHKQLISSLAQP